MIRLQLSQFLRLPVSACLLFFATSVSSGATFYVNGSCGNNSWTGQSSVCSGPNGPKLTIQAAIDAASNLDTVEIANGTYAGTGNRNILVNKNLVIRSTSNDPEMCIIDCENLGRGFKIDGSTTISQCRLEGITITHGSGGPEAAIEPFPEFLGDEGAGVVGGGVYVLSPATIRNCVIADNAVTFDGAGGGICIGPVAASRIEDTQITENTAGAGGGVVCQSSSLTEFWNCTIDDNTSLTRGGGVLCVSPDLETAASMALINCVIASNEAGPWPYCNQFVLDNWGAGLYVHSAQVEIVNCTIDSNVATACDAGNAFGGGIAVYDGGNIWLVPTSLLMTNCLISANIVQTGPTFAPNGSGGGLFNEGGTIEMVSCTIVANAAEAEGGGFYDAVGSGTGRTSKFENSIWWDNFAGDDGASMSLNDDENSIEVRNSVLRSAEIGGSETPSVMTAVFEDDPLFLSSVNYRLSFNSPYLNNGSTSLLPADVFDLDGDSNVAEVIPFDLDLNARQNNPSGCVDIGAFEQQTAGTLGCLADISGTGGTPDGLVNVIDLLLVITRWGTPGGIADFTPTPCGDANVGVSELLAILNGWGDCDSLDEAPESVEDCQNKCAQSYSITSQDYADCVDACVRALCELELLPPEDCP